VTSLLHLDSSANRSGESVSRALTALFADTWQAVHGSSEYRYHDLAAEPVPPLSTAYCTLGRRLERDGLAPAERVAALATSPAEEREWALTHPLVVELLGANTVVIGAPMYNYTIAASLKAWIDRVSFPGAFTDPRTGRSRLRDTRIVVVSARGGSPGEAMDFQTGYLRAYFGRLGVNDIHVVTAELTLSALVPRLAGLRTLAADSLNAARAEVIALAAQPKACSPSSNLSTSASSM
jgi:FMN-dependent NADH-azoreductase